MNQLVSTGAAPGRVTRRRCRPSPSSASRKRPSASAAVVASAVPSASCSVTSAASGAGASWPRRASGWSSTSIVRSSERNCQRAGVAAARERRRLEHGVVQELGEVSVETAQAERGLREVGHVTRNRIGAPEHGTQLPEQLVVGLGGHAAPPCKAGSTPTNEWSFSRQRIRVGPMAPIGMPSAAPIVS